MREVWVRLMRRERDTPGNTDYSVTARRFPVDLSLVRWTPRKHSTANHEEILILFSSRASGHVAEWPRWLCSPSADRGPTTGIVDAEPP